MLSDRTLPLVDYYSVVRCTCGKPISGAQWNMYQRLLKEGIRDVEYNDRAVAMEITIGNPQSSEEALDFIDVGLKMKSCCRLSFQSPVAVLSNKQERSIVDGKQYFSIIGPTGNNKFTLSLPSEFTQPIVNPNLDVSTLSLTDNKTIGNESKSKSTLELIASGQKNVSISNLTSSFQNLSILPTDTVTINFTPERRINVGSGMTTSKVPIRYIRAI